MRLFKSYSIKTCPSSGCENIQDVLFHLLCEDSLELESEFETSSGLNPSISIETENGPIAMTFSFY
jgi:hypothetical protein